jgi:uroporphyrinogen-III synthase
MAQSGISGAEWLVFSSPRGVQACLELKLGLRAGQNIACVGAATAEACTKAIGAPALVARGASAVALAAELLGQPDWERAALIGAEDSRPELEAALRAAGKDVRVCPVYTTEFKAVEGCFPSIQTGDAVFVASPSAFQALVDSGALPTSITLISIGPSTSQAIRGAGHHVAAESITRDVHGMLNALQEVLQETK